MTATQPERVLFARIGWMTYYSGSQEGDERPVGGGKYNKTNVGHEVYNFKNVNGHLYGYFENMSSIAANLARIDPTSKNAESLDRVLVIFVARRQEFGQVVVGWYANAKVFRAMQKSTPQMQRDGYDYSLTARCQDAVLLPTSTRFHRIPWGKKAMGRSNSCYAYDGKGNRLALPWMDAAIRFIQDYDGGNLLESPDDEFYEEVGVLLESHRAAQSGQGFRVSPELRKALEDYSVEMAVRHFRGLEYSVEKVGRTRCYDLECRKGNEVLRVEVKGTQSEGRSVILTPNEVESAKQHRTALYICHGIQVTTKWKKKFRLAGGIASVLDPWNIQQHGRLKPVTYTYDLA